MTKYNGPEDIYKELVGNPDEDWLYGLVAFAIVEEWRVEWMYQQQENTGCWPDADEIKAWYQQHTEGRLMSAQKIAADTLWAFSQQAYHSALAQHGENIRNDVIVAEIRRMGSFWRQFGINVVAGFVSAFLFAALLAAVAFFVISDRSPAEIGEALRDKIEEASHG